VFNNSANERLTEWKKFRDTLETSNTPFDDVAEFWSHAPFVSDFLDPNNSTSWPDPWHLILDGRFDDLAITLGMLYTILLTQRFTIINCEIHMSIVSNNQSPTYWLTIDGDKVLNYHYKQVVTVDKTEGTPSTMIYSTNSLQ
jgi:hypothetical protein